LDIHGIDFIPYIHKINSDRPDWLVVDFDAGRKVEFQQTKRVVREAFKFLESYNLLPRIKFSGSRGFQIWVKFEPHELPPDYVPKKLASRRRERSMFSFYSDMVRYVQAEISKRLPGLTTAETAKKEEREDKVLLDASIIKPMGDVRAPYSMHVKTGLISLPISLQELEEFQPEMADPDIVAARYQKLGNEFVLEPADGSQFFRDVVSFCRE
jgi:DNA primase